MGGRLCRVARRGLEAGLDERGGVRQLLELREGKHAVVGRRLSGKEATLTAAGATVAVIGTAAIVRRARRKRRT